MLVVGGLKFGAIYALAALGIVVIHKATRTVNFAHGAFVLAGAYATYGIVEGLKLGYWPAYFLVPIAAGLLAAAIELIVLRPIRQADMFAVITSTIFIGIGLSEVYRLVQNTEMLGVPNPVPGPPFFLGGAIITREQIWVFAGAISERAHRTFHIRLCASRPGLASDGRQSARGRVVRLLGRHHECDGLVPRRRARGACRRFRGAQQGHFTRARNFHDHGRIRRCGDWRLRFVARRPDRRPHSRRRRDARRRLTSRAP